MEHTKVMAAKVSSNSGRSARRDNSGARRKDGAPPGPGSCNNPLCAVRIRELENELVRLRSVGLDVLKQQGQWQASGQRPEEIGLEYDDLFNHEVDAMADSLTTDAHMDDNQARQLLSTTFQEVYSSCKEAMLEKLTKALSRVVELPEKSEDDEELYDVCRAYGLLVNTVKSHDTSGDYGSCAKKVNAKLKKKAPEVDLESLTAKMSELSWKMLNIVPPLVSQVITDSSFQSDWHSKEMKPLWNDALDSYNLDYYRPILFFSYEGKVAQRGWIGNRPLESHGKDSSSKHGTLSPISLRDDTGNPYGFPEDDGIMKTYKKPISAGSNSSDGFELLDLNPDLSRERELESTVVLSDPFQDEDSEDSEKGEEEQTVKKFGLKIT